MTIRVLCLHGMGTNATILHSQLKPIFDLCSSKYDLIFPDAPWECDPYPGVTEIYGGPYLAWIRSPSTDQVAYAHKHLERYLSEPIDLVIGFSQGAALAASLLLHAELAGKPAPFKAAMLICSPLPSTISPDHGIDVRSYFGINGPVIKQPNILPEDLTVRDDYFLKIENSNSQDSNMPVYYNLFHADVDFVRITIPTAHVYGRQDRVWRQQSMSLVMLCSGQILRYEHGGGHEIPRDDAEAICDLIEELVHG
ncbi:Serine hydrolase FSH [Penicillium herquei]|nr:Serine hydrolase FSH [Penicillium herquei]